MAIAFLLGTALVAIPVIGGRAVGGGELAAVERLDGPAASQLRWVLSRLGEGASESELRQHFAAAFLEAVPADKLNPILVQVGAEGPFDVETVEPNGPTALSVTLKGPRHGVAISIAVEPEPPHLITGLFFKPVERRVQSANFDELVAALRKAAPEVTFLAADVVDGQCRTVHAVDPDKALALGSAFKLYVLGAVAQAVIQGDLTWEQMVPVRDDQLVHTSQRFGAQTTRRQGSVEELAQAMIEVSDNTATDVLLELVGRHAVEAAQARMGMSAPAANVPFLSTREMTLLKWGRPPLAAEFLAQGDAAARRRFLDERLSGRPAREQDVDFTPHPNHIEAIEWFASASDLCRAHLALADLARRPVLAPLAQILGTNPGLPFEPQPKHVSFKGGSEPGVLAGSWLIAGPDDERVMIVILLRNTAGAIDTEALRAAEDAYRLLLD
ncbi:MAG TPA: serine hydrolase [Acidimicrobiales bacterium]|nr:serine hydrolase [Acidimicrobiales bacterium]